MDDQAMWLAIEEEAYHEDPGVDDGDPAPEA